VLDPPGAVYDGISQVLSLLKNLVVVIDVPSIAVKSIVPNPTAPVAAVLVVPVI